MNSWTYMGKKNDDLDIDYKFQSISLVNYYI